MKNFWHFFILISFLSIASLPQASAQRTSDNEKEEEIDDYFDESKGFKHRLWYGGNFILGFISTNRESQFSIGVTPMVGYKITDELSVGPRATIIYSHYRYQFSSGNVESVNSTEYGVGAFLRYKVYRNFFAHGEYEILSDIIGYQFGPGETLTPVRRERGNGYLGAGFNSGGRFGYEILLLYNLTIPENDPSSPFSIRFGFTYKF